MTDLRALEKAATAGPWRAIRRNAMADYAVADVMAGYDDFMTGPLRAFNAEFIAEFRNAAPFLLDLYYAVTLERCSEIATGHHATCCPTGRALAALDAHLESQP